MPKRVLDFDAMWGSDKLAACAAWAQGEYAWLYGLADASGCFEITNLRVIWGRVAAIRGNFSIERLEQVFAEFQDKGLLFVWEHEGKRYAHWTGSDVPGRLPPPSWRMRLERFAPPVPKQMLAEYMARFARGRAALAGVGFRGEPEREIEARSGVKDGLEGAQGQDLGLDWNLNGKWGVGRDEGRGGPRNAQGCQGAGNHERKTNQTDFYFSNSNSKSSSSALTDVNSNASASSNSTSHFDANLNSTRSADFNSHSQPQTRSAAQSPSQAGSLDASSANGARRIAEGAEDGNSASQREVRAWSERERSAAPVAWRDKEAAVARELRVGQGPVCGPGRVRAEVLERVRKRDAAIAALRSPRG
jgi:hypothetical protein